MGESRLEKAIPARTAQRIYDRLGKRYDRIARFYARIRHRAYPLLDLFPGLNVLEIGVATGPNLTYIQPCITPGGRVFGIDLSWTMLQLSKKLNTAMLCQADARTIPFAGNYFDRILISYVLDLVPKKDIPGILSETLRIMKPGGRILIIALTEGINIPTRMLVSVWKALYTISPIACAGCRPQQVSQLLENAGYCDIEREVVVKLAVPSEIVVATKKQPA